MQTLLKATIALITIPLILFANNCHAQKLLSKTKDPFTGKIQIATYPINLVEISKKIPVIQLTGVKIIDSTVKYLFNISNTYLGNTIIDSDTTNKKCILKMENGVFVEGKYGGTVITPIIDKKIISTGFYFEEYQAKELAQHAVVAVTFKGANDHQGTYEIQNKLRYSIANLCKFLLNQ